MRLRTMFITGLAVGYVLGTHAGHGRYNQLRRLSRRLTESPTVQEAAGVLRARAAELTSKNQPRRQSPTTPTRS